MIWILIGGVAYVAALGAVAVAAAICARLPRPHWPAHFIRTHTPSSKER